MTPTPFTDPYGNLPQDKIMRLNSWCSLDDYVLLKSVRPSRGTLQTTINLLLRKFCHDLRLAGITKYDPTTFEHFICDRCTLVNPVPKPNDPNDPGAVGTPGNPPQSLTFVSPNIKGVVERRIGGVGDGAKPTEKKKGNGFNVFKTGKKGKP